MSDLEFKGAYALSNDSPRESLDKSAGAPATNLLDVKLDILMGMFVKFQDSVELQQSKTTHEMAEMRFSLCGHFVVNRCCYRNKKRSPDNELTLSSTS